MTMHFLRNKALRALVALLLTSLLFSACQKSINEPDAADTAALRAGNKTNASASALSAAVALDWYKLQERMFLYANPATNNSQNSDAFAYIGIALYEAVRPGIKNSVSLSESLYMMPQMPGWDNNGYDLVVSANAAIASMVRGMYSWLTTANKASVDSLENAYNENVGVSMESEKFRRSQAYGRAVAAAVLSWSQGGRLITSNAGYVIPTTPEGVWIPIPPVYANPVQPFIGTSRPLLQAHATGIVPSLPFGYSESPSSPFYAMVKEVYDASLVRTEDQRKLALYWNDLGVGIGYTPIGHIINMITQAIEQNGVDLATAAQAYAKAGIAVRDGQLVLFRSKYQYLVMRPVSYIRKLWDANWLPVIPTPPHPEYPSAHAFLTAATMRAASTVLGNIPVVDHTYDFLGYAPRPHATLDAVADESGLSRFYAGIHYKPSVAAGLAGGRAVGDRVGSIKMVE